MSYQYDRRTAGGHGPVRTVLDKWWNELHDLERELEDASFDYDRAASYAGGKGAQDAKRVMQAIKAAVDKINDLTSGNGSAFDKLLEAEADFIKKHGEPSQYIREQQDRMGLK